MCGITGIYAFNVVGGFNMINVTAATEKLSDRGPDAQDIYHDQVVALGHRRLSIIDTSQEANQPMWDESGRYCIIFNGEIYNYKTLRADLEQRGVAFRTQCDTEVLLKLYITSGKACLERLNGFFAFAIYDKENASLFIARDRFGIKPLLYYHDEDKFLFASEMKSLLCYGLERKINYQALYQFLQLNYITAPQTIFSGVHKLLPGHYIHISNTNVEISKWYTLTDNEIEVPGSYTLKKKKLEELMEESVADRLVADVPLGSFLSGGIDSSVVAALACRRKPDLHTFSIGFADEPFFDETNYSRLVADKIGSNHHVFSLTNENLYQHLDSILNYLDEPFADSSAIAVYILSRETRQHATVALSGDGADEMLAGYNKHAAFYRLFNQGSSEKMVGHLQWLWAMLPKSRYNTFTNKVRQLHRFGLGVRQPKADAYWSWAGFLSENQAANLLSEKSRSKIIWDQYYAQKHCLLEPLGRGDDMNAILSQDLHMVLPNDMLTKVDLMSMANGLEVRVPFLDHRVVEYVHALPAEDKINARVRKRILQDTFRDILPDALYNRPKKGFEVPLLKWFRQELRTKINDEWLDEKFIQEQGIFDPVHIRKIKRRLFSRNPGDVHAQVWALVVFQHWWIKYVGG